MTRQRHQPYTGTHAVALSRPFFCEGLGELPHPKYWGHPRGGPIVTPPILFASTPGLADGSRLSTDVFGRWIGQETLSASIASSHGNTSSVSGSRAPIGLVCRDECSGRAGWVACASVPNQFYADVKKRFVELEKKYCVMREATAGFKIPQSSYAARQLSPRSTIWVFDAGHLVSPYW